MSDHDLVRRLRVTVVERLGEQRRRDVALGYAPMAADDEREYARSLIVQALEDHARSEIAQGRMPPDATEEARLVHAVHATSAWPRGWPDSSRARVNSSSSSSPRAGPCDWSRGMLRRA